MLKTKLISFEMGQGKTSDSAKELAKLVDLHKSGQPVSIEEWQRKGLPVSGRLIKRRGVGDYLLPILEDSHLLEDGSLIPETIPVLGEKYRVMKNPVTVGQFRQFVESTDYEMIGDHTDMLKAMLEFSPAEECLKYLSMYDGRAYARWLCEKTGNKWRTMFGEERIKLGPLFGLHTSRAELTEAGKGKVDLIIYNHKGITVYNCIPPSKSDDDTVIRLVVEIQEKGNKVDA